MKWISKEPPLYVWDFDHWINEKNGKEYFADVISRFWIHDLEGEEIPFPNKTMIRTNDGWLKHKK